MQEPGDIEQDGVGSSVSTMSITWRRLDARLWVGRLDNRPWGTIEQGRFFDFIDLAGDRHAGYPTLEDAKRAAAQLIPIPPRARPDWLRVTRLAIATVVVASVLAVVWAVLRYSPFW